MTHPFEGLVLKSLARCSGGALLLAAVSGGADSTALLVSLSRLRLLPAAPPFGLRCVHVEHGLRPPEESLGDAAAVKSLCKSLGVPCRVVHIPRGRVEEAARKGIGVEAAARLFRRRILLKEVRRTGAARILTGHTRDDALENMLIRLLRGAGPAGLAPMPRERGLFLRPLLEAGRAQTQAYLQGLGIPWRADSTNADTRFLRNRVRLRLIPLLDECFPRWRKGIEAMSRTQGLTAEFLSQEAAQRLPWKRLNPDSAAVPWENFASQPQILREEALFQGALLLRRVPSRRAVRRAGGEPLLVAEPPTFDLGPLRALKRNDQLVIEKTSSWEEGFAMLITGPGVYVLKPWGLRITVSTEGPGFPAALPLSLFSRGTVQRPRLSAKVEAVDPLGPAAALTRGKNGLAVKAAGPREGRAMKIFCEDI